LDQKELLLQIQRRPVTFVPGKKVVSTLPGEWTSPFAGKGYEPMGYRDFQLGDDPRRINLTATARRGVPTIVERVALRDFKVMIVVDGSASMRVREKMEIQISAVALLLYSAWQAETTFGLGIRTETGIRSLGLGIGSRHFYHLYRALWDFYTGNTDGRNKGIRIPINSCLPPNAMLFYCSDFLEGDGKLVDLARLWRSVQRYDFVPLIIQDELEYGFPAVTASTFIPFANPETGTRREIWITPRIATDIRSVHESRYQDLVNQFGARGIHPLPLDTVNVEVLSREVDRYFRKRKGRHAA
jgi:hypothetical protein